jgi:hypothetical protein
MDEETQIQYAAVLADLERERDELDALIARLRKKAGEAHDAEPAGLPANGTAKPSSGAETSKTVPAALTASTFFGMTIPDGIRAYLRMAKRPTPSPVLIKALSDGGLQSTSKNFAASIRTTLTRLRGEVVNLPTGWALVEWYPGRSFTKKTNKKKNKKKRQVRREAGPDALP